MKNLKAWSFSRWRKYDQCARSAKHAYIDKLPDPPGPAMKRGSDVHEACEEYLKAPADHPVPCPPEALDFADEMEALRVAPGIYSEEEWAFKADWSKCGWFDKDAWFRAKVDARHGKKTDGVMYIVDFKTGCKPPRQPGPIEQDQRELYALAAFKRFGDALREVNVDFWYFDRPLEAQNVYHDSFTRADLAALEEKWGVRSFTLTNDTDFAKSPGKYCFWCPYHTKKGGPCNGREDRGDGLGF